LVAALALVAVPTGASAEISVDPAFTILYVKGDDGPNQIAVECRDGLVTVNDSPAANGQASCADLEKLLHKAIAHEKLLHLVERPELARSIAIGIDFAGRRANRPSWVGLRNFANRPTSQYMNQH